MHKKRCLTGKTRDILVSLVLYPLMGSFAAPAEADENSSMVCDEVVVTANRVAIEESKLGSSVTVITSEEIKQKQKRTVADILRDVPGLAVSNNGGRGRLTAVRIRGMDSYHTKVLIDGVDVSDPSAPQPAYDFAHLLADDIERIEIVRGPQSLLYGSEAIGGVINITTKQGTGDPTVTAFGEVGSLHSYTGSAGVRGKTDRLSYALNATHTETDGISAASARNSNRERDPYWNQTVTASLGLAMTDRWSVDAKGRMMRSQYDIDDWGQKAASDGTEGAHRQERSGRLSTTWSMANDRLSNTIAYSISESERDYYKKTKVQTGYDDGETQSWEYQGTARLATNHTLVFGAERKTESTGQSSAWSSLAADVSTNGYFLDYQFSPVESLFLTVGGRLDDHQSYGTHKTWRSTAAYLLDATQTRFHGSYGTAFRAPSLYELYAPTYGNRDLSPEKSRGWDVGVEQTLLGEAATVDVTWFVERLKNKIGWSHGYKNVASARAQGVEVSAAWTITDDWSVKGNYTFTDSRDASGLTLARRPKHQGSLSVGWAPGDAFSATTTLRAVGRQYDSATQNWPGGFVTMDVAAAYEVTPSLSLTGRIDNITDKQYEEVDTYGTLGRMAYVGVRTQF